MCARSETESNHATVAEPQDMAVPRVLVLVQNHLIIATFPEQQVEAAIDLARVLCRALAQTVDLFRINPIASDDVQVGALANSGSPEWVRLAHVRATFLKGVKVEIYDPEGGQMW